MANRPSLLNRIPLSIPDLRGNEASYLAACVRDNWVSSAGPQITDFERRMAVLTGRAHAVATVNGSAALHLALVGLGIGPGDMVAVPDWTFAASVNAVVHAGATPLLLDVTARDWGLDADLLAQARRDYPLKAVIAVHPLGHCCDIGAILAAAGDLPVIEDAAGAIGATWSGKPAGAFGRAAIFSFNGNKTVTAGGGGMIVTDNQDLATRARHLSTQARVGAAYRHDEIGFNFRMTNLNAAVGLAQLERLDEMVAAKRAIAARYRAAFVGVDGLSHPPQLSDDEGSAWLSAVRTSGPAAAASLISALSAAGIEARTFWESLAGQPPYAAFPSLLRGVSAGLSGSVVTLPSSSSLSPADQDRVIEAVCGWARSRAAA